MSDTNGSEAQAPAAPVTVATVEESLASFANLLDGLDQGSITVTPAVHRELVAQLAVIRAAALGNRQQRRARARA